MKKTVEYGWSRSVLTMQIELEYIKGKDQAITNFQSKLASPQSDLAHYTLKDPYIFDFLSVGNEAHEREVEQELTKHIEKFLLEQALLFVIIVAERCSMKTQHYTKVIEFIFNLLISFHNI